MAITRAQQFKQMLAQGGRIGLFRGAEADARAGRGDISPGTDRGGNVRGGDEGGGLRLRGTIDRRPPTITPEPKPRDDMFFGDEPMPMMGPSLRTRVGRGIRSVFDKTLLGPTSIMVSIIFFFILIIKSYHNTDPVNCFNKFCLIISPLKFSIGDTF